MEPRSWVAGLAFLVSLAFTTLAAAQTVSTEQDRKARLLSAFEQDSADALPRAIESLATSELIVNGGFEAGQAPGPAIGYSGTSGSWNWTTSDGMLNPIWTDTPSHTGPPTARTGAWCVYFTPFGPASNSVSQQVTIPTGSTAKLTFWVKIGTFETSSYFSYDTLTVQLQNSSGGTLSTLATFSNLTPTAGYDWVQKTFDVSAWAGQAVRVRFSSYNDSTRSTVFLLDDVSLAASTGGPGPDPGYEGTWLLPSSARVAGSSAFWTTDLSVTNPTSTSATVYVKFLGHDGAGPAGPERLFTIPARATSTWQDVLGSVFGRETDWGPILVRSESTALVAQGQTWTAGPSGGGFGQSVPAIGPAETVGASARTLTGVRQDSRFRTNVVLANMKDAEAQVVLDVFRADGIAAASTTVTLGPLGFRQLNLANDLGVSDLSNGSIRISSRTSGAQVAAYASVIDATTSDPRTILAR